MSGLDTIVRVIAVTVLVPILVFVGWVGVKLMDAVTGGLNGPPASLGWPSMTHIYFFMSLGFVGLVLVVFIWNWVAPIRDDVRQDVRRQGPF